VHYSHNSRSSKTKNSRERERALTSWKMGFGGDDVIGGGWRREARAAADYHCHFIFIIALVVSKRIKRWLLMFLLAFYVSLNPLGVGSMR